MSKQVKSSDSAFVSVKVPRMLVQLIEFTAKSGKSYDMFVVSLPDNTWVDGLDVSNYQFRSFANTYNLEQYRSDAPLVTLSLRKEDRVVLRLLADDGDSVADSVEVSDVFRLVHVLKQKRELFDEYGSTALYHHAPQQVTSATPVHGVPDADTASDDALQSDGDVREQSGVYGLSR